MQEASVTCLPQCTQMRYQGDGKWTCAACGKEVFSVINPVWVTELAGPHARNGTGKDKDKGKDNDKDKGNGAGGGVTK